MTAKDREFGVFLAVAVFLHAAALYSTRLDLPPPPPVLRLRLAPVSPSAAGPEQSAPLAAAPDAARPPSTVDEALTAIPPTRAEGAVSQQEPAREEPAPSSAALPMLPRAEPMDAPASELESIDAQARASYEQLLAAWLDRHKYYPSALRRRGIEGEGVLRVRLGRDGRVVAVESADGFENAMLETVARDWIARADPFPPVPDNVAGSYYLVRFPVRFRLQ